MIFNKTIYESRGIKLVANYSGITDNIALASDIKLQFTALNKVTLEEIFNETLDIGNMRSLYSHLNSISIITDSSESESSEFMELSSDSVLNFLSTISVIDESIISTVLGKIGHLGILKSLSILDLDNLSASHKQQKYKKELKKLKLILHLEELGCLKKVIGRLSFISEYSAGQEEKILQNWLENNLWVFGIEYERMEGFRQISLTSEGDLIMKSIDGYLDLIELKKSKYDLLRFDGSHNCYYKSSHLSKVLGQSMHYIKGLQDYSEQLSNIEDVKVLRPRIKIIGGRSYSFNEQEYDTLRMINSHLVDISIITYDEILQYGEKIISHYE